MPDCFISYCSKDAAFAKAVYKDLTDHGLVVWRDGNPKYPANDVDAKAAGLDKCVRVSDSSVSYHYPPDRKEMVLSGAYTWTAW